MRNPVFDIMKGIGIVAVIIGHCPIHEDLLKFIFIWHMPLFFFISGYFFRSRCNMDMLNNNMKNLVVPYYFTCFILLLLTVIRFFLVGKGNPLGVFFGAIMGSGSTNNPRIFGGHTFIGAIWFLLALAWCRIIYNILFIRIKLYTKRITVVVVLSLSASVLGRYLYVPTDFIQGVSALVFFLAGNMCKEYGWVNSCVKNYWLWGLVSLPFLYLGILMRPMGMVDNNYQIWPLNVMAALGGISLVYIVSKVLNHYRLGGGIISYRKNQYYCAISTLG